MTDIVQRIAVKALIINDSHQVLLLQKSQDDARHAHNSGRYNLPGGKINPGETLDAALRREVQEEVGLCVVTHHPRPIFVGQWAPTVRGVPHQIIGMFFICQKWQGTLQLDSEHSSYAWVNRTNFTQYDILPPEDQALKAYFQR